MMPTAAVNTELVDQDVITRYYVLNEHPKVVMVATKMTTRSKGSLTFYYSVCITFYGVNKTEEVLSIESQKPEGISLAELRASLPTRGTDQLILGVLLSKIKPAYFTFTPLT